jgi:hypothetical protein
MSKKSIKLQLEIGFCILVFLFFLTFIFPATMILLPIISVLAIYICVISILYLKKYKEKTIAIFSLVVASLIIIYFVSIFISIRDETGTTWDDDSNIVGSGEDYLRENYGVSYFGCGEEYGMIDMVEQGDRVDQLFYGLMSLYEDCPNSEVYSIHISETMEECYYFFGGTLIRAWFESVNQDGLITEESKRLIENDTSFSDWLNLGQGWYEFIQENGTSELYSDRYLFLSRSYEYYIENGITKELLDDYMWDEMIYPYACDLDEGE